MKRFFDILVSAIGLFLLAVPLALLAWQVRRKLGRPVLFTQVRPGLHGKSFRMVKFRTMTDERGPDGALLSDEQRLTSFGRLLRASSLDELPELINVLKGDMSVVGPRPHALPHNDLYKDKLIMYMQRHRVKPGITGWAQINGFRGETDTREKMARRVA